MGEKTSGLFCAIIRFTNLKGEPLAGPEWTVEAVDEDPLADDDLGTSTLDANGEGRVFIAVADISSIDSPAERNPDLYFVLRHYGTEVYRTPVRHQVDFESLDPVTGGAKHLTQDFGTCQVDIGN